MKSILRSMKAAAGLTAVCLPLTQCASGPTTSNASASQIASDSRAALKDLYKENSKARQLGNKAKGVLVFPHIAKGGFIVGGMGGNGALIRNDGTIRDYYQTGGLSWGFQAGAQKYGYALFLMDQKAFDALNQVKGWDLGSSPNIVVVDKAMATTLSTTTANKGTYAFIFNQTGLMGGVGLQGSKVTRIQPGR